MNMNFKMVTGDETFPCPICEKPCSFGELGDHVTHEHNRRFRLSIRFTVAEEDDDEWDTEIEDDAASGALELARMKSECKALVSTWAERAAFLPNEQASVLTRASSELKEVL